MNFINLLLSTLVPAVRAADTINLENTNSAYNKLYDLTPSRFVNGITNILLGVGGIAAFLYLLWGGVQWITAGSDKDALDKARRRIITAMTGIIIVLSVYVFLFVIKVLFQVNLQNFTLTNL